MSEKLHAVAQQNNRPFVQVAAWIKRRTYRSRDKPRLRCVRPNDRTWRFPAVTKSASKGVELFRYKRS